MMIISVILVIVNLDVTPVATCGSLASTVSDAYLDCHLVCPNR